MERQSICRMLSQSIINRNRRVNFIHLNKICMILRCNENGKQSEIIEMILPSDQRGNDFNHLDMNFDR